MRAIPFWNDWGRLHAHRQAGTKHARSYYCIAAVAVGPRVIGVHSRAVYADASPASLFLSLSQLTRLLDFWEHTNSLLVASTKCNKKKLYLFWSENMKNDHTKCIQVVK